MKISKDNFFFVTCILFATITVRAGSVEKPITPGETIFSSIPRNSLSSFFALTASNENTSQADTRYIKPRQWYETTIHSRSTFTVGCQPYTVAFDGINI